ncbi:DnaB-like helicase C-terminal domain-containing protein [Chelatococcus sp. XZ-Ab1]|uniref:replicative DNA helicase n=1 Tax=Chelatococcus sp. XZ-Ab1 TaxID=3034027 RepID=UPI0023E47486|nr:DnaB-like helicase C-terminal domain-containing protein [Chelatococcus sp. XZ-Ab1]
MNETNDLPHSLDSEMALIGAVLVRPEALERALDLVSIEDFVEPIHARIWEAMAAASARGDAINATLVREAIGNSDLGGATVGEYLQRLYGEASTLANLPGYARAVRNSAALRRIVWTGKEMIQRAMAASVMDDPAPIAAGAIEELDAVSSASLSEHVRRVTLDEAMVSAIEASEQARTGNGLRGAPYGIPSLDKMTMGARPGQLIILAGRPGMGKTTVGVALGLKTAARGHGVYFVSLEMVAQELAERALASLCWSAHADPITYQAIAEGVRLRDVDFARLRRAREKYGNDPIVIEQQSGLSVQQIIARARQVRTSFERRGRRLAVIMVDHLGLVRPSQRYAGSRVQEVAEITAALKVAAKELGVAVVLLCQLSRQTEQRASNDRRPQLADLRDSGAIEQDADVVIGLYREAYYLRRKGKLSDEESARLADVEDRIEIEILKQRQGPTGRLTLYCNVSCNVIEELAE